MSDLILVKCKNCPLFYFKEFEEYLELLESGDKFGCRSCTLENL